MNDVERYRLLLVDYDHDLLTRLKVLLTDKGYDTTAAWGGSEASAIIGSEGFDLILLSDHLPDMNARELWRFLRKIPADAELALIQGSGPVTGDVRALFQEYAGHCVLPRTTPGQMESAITHCLRHQKAAGSPINGTSPDKDAL